MKQLTLGIILAATTLCAALMLFSSTARAETTQCTAAITSIPTTITTQGIYCLTGNLAGNLTTGDAITISTNNVTIDFNGYKLGNLAAGPATYARGIYAKQKKNITIRNGTIRGFNYGILLSDDSNYTNSSGHLIEDLRLDGNTYAGMLIAGTGSIVRNSQVVKTGGSTHSADAYAFGIMAYGPGSRVLNNEVIDVVSATGNTYGIYISQGDGTVVEGNRISNVSTSGLSYGIIMGYSLNVMLSDNRIAGVPHRGILYDTGTATGIFMNNTVSGSGTPFSGGSAASNTNFSN